MQVRLLTTDLSRITPTPHQIMIYSNKLDIVPYKVISNKCFRQIFKQGQIIEEMERLLTEFDQQVENLSEERMQLSIDIKYLEIFVNVLNQELHIVHSYDETETAILERVNYSLAEKHTKHLKVKTIIRFTFT